MLHAFAADLLVILHLGFILFVATGGLLALRWPRLAWAHVPAAAWGAMLELGGWICPLTPLENSLRHCAGQAGYEGGFLEYYLLPLVYPPELTRGIQIGLGIAVVTLNLFAYGALLIRHRRANR
ncbi:MAG: DUF2784 domain-containing protein [Chromatiaceae bacterium]|jgi:hypothetical protein|nr:DUF2784 domain-containing protein [Chromatiaceae bacterium]